uniref:Protein TAX4 n=1 Tax=Anthurium amnicola TaxID=1678845 RepID=A0A1D1YRY8_9ARAE
MTSSSFFPILVLLTVSLAFNNGGCRARQVTPRVEGLPQVKSENSLGNMTRNSTRTVSFARPILPGHANTHPSLVDGNEVYHWGVLINPTSDYYGAKATISVYDVPGVETKQASDAVIWVYDFPPEDCANAISAGWHVCPELYGDAQTHLFIQWTADNYQNTGCYNLECPGFVVKSNSPIIPGDALTSVSNFGGEQKYITLSIHKEPEGDWWLHYGEGTEVTTAVGYWPRSLFGNLANKANFIEWGGTVIYPKGTLGPAMGSGHFSGEGANRAASFKNLQFMDESNDFKVVDSRFGASAYSSSKGCYDVTVVPETSADDGFQFYYGGPPGCSDEH